MVKSLTMQKTLKMLANLLKSIVWLLNLVTFGINEVNKMEFIKDVLSRKMSLKQVCKKYDITIDDILERYQQERSKFTDEQIEVIMNEVYYQ
jgi:hypothetical protein